MENSRTIEDRAGGAAPAVGARWCSAEDDDSKMAAKIVEERNAIHQEADAALAAVASVAMMQAKADPPALPIGFNQRARARFVGAEFITEGDSRLAIKVVQERATRVCHEEATRAGNNGAKPNQLFAVNTKARLHPGPKPTSNAWVMVDSNGGHPTPRAQLGIAWKLPLGETPAHSRLILGLQT